MMAVWDPVVPVECDGCKEVEYFEMTALAGGCFDLRHLDAKLKRGKWQHHGQVFLCPECSSNEENGETP